MLAFAQLVSLQVILIVFRQRIELPQAGIFFGPCGLFSSQSFLRFHLQRLFLFSLRDQFGNHGVFCGLVVLRGVLDVNFPTGQPCRKPHVLPLTTDGQAELVGRNQHMGVLTDRIHETDHLHPRRTEGVGDVLAGVLGPADHIDLLAAQFVHHLLNA